MMFEVVKDKDLIGEVENYDVILVVTSVYSKLDNGFQSKLRYKFPIIQEINDAQPYADLRRLGTRKTITETTPIISLCYACPYPMGKNYLNKEAYENCLATANAEFKGKRVACTVLGASKFDGAADKKECLETMQRLLCDVDVTVYDYEQIPKQNEIWELRKKICKAYYYKNRTKFDQLMGQIDYILHKLYLGPDPTIPRYDAKKQLEIRNIKEVYAN